MYKMNTGMLLALVATTAALTITTSSIGVGIFSQHANAASGNGNGATQFKGFPCTLHTDGTTTEMHAVITHSGQANLDCHS